MKKILFILLLVIPFIGFGQVLIGYGCDGDNVYKTTNGGIDWTYISPENMVDLYFISQNIGYGCDGDNVYKTTNGGIDWTYISPENMVGLYFISGNITNLSTFNSPTSSNRKLEKVVNMLGIETKLQQNIPFIEIYDDGSTEKKLIIEK